MPKELWLPGGKGGGGKRAEFYTYDEVRKAQAAAVEAERRRSDETWLEAKRMFGYDLNRPVPCPKALSDAPESPVDAPNWTMPLRIGLAILAVCVLVGVWRVVW